MPPYDASASMQSFEICTPRDSGQKQFFMYSKFSTPVGARFRRTIVLAAKRALNASPATTTLNTIHNTIII
jgi:hypothetical protein